MEQETATEETKTVSKNKHQLGIIPEDGFMRCEQVIAILCESRTGLYRRIQRGEYPAPFKLPGGRTSVWAASDVREMVVLIEAGKTWADREETAA